MCSCPIPGNGILLYSSMWKKHGSSTIPTPVSGMTEQHRLHSVPQNTPEDIRAHRSSQHTLKDLKVGEASGGRDGRSSFLTVLSSQTVGRKVKDWRLKAFFHRNEGAKRKTGKEEESSGSRSLFPSRRKVRQESPPKNFSPIFLKHF